MSTLIHAVSGPRNISTALMYSFAQRAGCCVMDEPFYGVYLEKTGIDHPGREETMAMWPTNSRAAIAQIGEKQEHCSTLYLKNMAHHMVDEPWDWAANAVHVFWIRHPRKVVQSFTKVISDITVDDIGLVQEWEVWQKIQNFKGAKVIVDSDEMLEDPGRTMPQVCQALGLDWDEAMLSWPSGAKDYDGPWWPHWYSAVHASTGFGPGKEMPEPLADRHEKVVEQAVDAYKNLYSNRLIFR